MAGSNGLESVFNSFCAFGAGSKGGAVMMDNAKFSKLFRDLNVFDKKFTSIDADIIFNRPEVKGKTDRKISFEQFKKALKLVAEKKYPGDADGYNKVVSLISSGSGPLERGTTKVLTTGGVDRLTDTSKYTGTHKERFDESGRGKGLAGRDSPKVEHTVGGLSSYVHGYKEEGTYDEKVKKTTSSKR